MARDDRFDDRFDEWDEGAADLPLADDEYDEADEWTAEDEARYQARRRQELKRVRRARRQAISFTVLVLLVLGAGIGAAGLSQGWWEWPFDDEASGAGATPTCGEPTPVAALPSETTVEVLNATEVRGLANAVSEVLTARGFTVSRIGNEETTIEVLESAQVRHGPDSVLQAQAVAAQFVSAVLIDDGREGRIVELSIGQGYRRMADEETAAAAMAPVPGPSPAGCIPPSGAVEESTDPAAPETTAPVTTP